MATEILYPNATNAEGTGISPVGAATAWEAIDDLRGAYDGITTYFQLFHTSATFHDAEHFDPISKIGSIDWVNHEVQGQRETGGAQALLSYFRINGSNYTLLTTTATSMSTQISSNVVANPDTGNRWMNADMFGNIVLIRDATGGASGANWTRTGAHNIQFSFVPASGTVIFLVALWLLPLLAHGVGAMPTLKELAQFYLLRHRFQVAPGGDNWKQEFQLIKEALRVRPVYIT